MKKTLLLFLIVTPLFSYCQETRFVDLKTTIAQPTEDFVLYGPGSDSVQVKLVNQGPDTIYPTDDAVVTLKFARARKLPVVQTVNAYVNPGDSLLLWIPLKFVAQVSIEDVQLCVFDAFLISPPAAPYRKVFYEKDSSQMYGDNTSCISGDLFIDQTSSIGSLTDQIGVTIYPNPTTGVISVSRLNPDSEARIELFSSTGILLTSTILELGESSISDLSNYSVGTYILRITQDGKSRSHLVVKQ